MAELSYLEELERRNAYVRDRVRGVLLRTYPGFYLHGPAGTAKTHTVRFTLDQIGAGYRYCAGHLTPMGLFDLIAENADATIVLDDVGSIFAQPVAVQILLAALGNQSHGPRLVKYRRQNDSKTVRFTGGIIAISNLELHSGVVLDALRSRVHVCCYNPTDDELAALMRHVTANGWARGRLILSPAECSEVTEHVIAEARRLGVRLDLRLLLDKALPDFAQWQAKQTETHWRDLVTLGMTQRVAELQHTPVRPREQRKQNEQELIRRVQAQYQQRKQQVKEWKSATGKSERAFWRRLREIEGDESGAVC